jgi:hypothetical protein
VLFVPSGRYRFRTFNGESPEMSTASQNMTMKPCVTAMPIDLPNIRSNGMRSERAARISKATLTRATKVIKRATLLDLRKELASYRDFLVILDIALTLLDPNSRGQTVVPALC